MTISQEARTQLTNDGFTLLPGVFAPALVGAMAEDLDRVFAEHGTGDAAIRGEEGSVYAARNLLVLWPGSADVWRKPQMTDALETVLGPGYGLVRILFFDKPPRQTWALPWHKDLTIAVKDNRLPSEHFRHPTAKAGVPHTEAPLAVLENMLTARIHLDDVTPENGALKVIPGSHHGGKALALDTSPPRCLFCRAGDVLLIRPLVAHCSGKSHPDTTRHRRVLHLEFAASPHLPDGYSWHTFVPGVRPAGGTGA
jgi:hypothetical protein